MVHMWTRENHDPEQYEMSQPTPQERPPVNATTETQANFQVKDQLRRSAGMPGHNRLTALLNHGRP